VVIRGRFAPSPTGDLHLGNARTALLGWLQARSAGGRFVVRVEDLDVGRVRDEYRQTHLLDLRWLGIDWDEGPDTGGEFGPYLQSLRTRHYEAALERLGNQNLLYACGCSRKEIAAAASAPHGPADDGPPYPGTCRTRATRHANRAAALRFRTRAGSVRFLDELQGEQSYAPALDVGDFVVQRKDGVAAYQLAVAVDDAAMAITHVLRGADLLASTSRQILLYEALELQPPRWIHVPLMLEAGGDRFAKRQGAPTLRSLREAGLAPERLVGWLAYTCGLAGWGEEAAPRDLVERFDLARLPLSDTPVTYPDWLGRTHVEGSVPSGNVTDRHRKR
jgi:glutamyl-tRNA synthetase